MVAMLLAEVCLSYTNASDNNNSNDRGQERETELTCWLYSEPIQSRCAVLRYSKLTDTQLLARLTEVCTSENVSYTDDGLEAVIFTAQGDMRQVR